MKTSTTKHSFHGLFIASGILLTFSSVWYHALFQIDIFRSSWIDMIGTFVFLEFLYTGLFITCHDAIHGSVCPRYRWLNNIIGQICFSAYAWFDYQYMYENHWRHHNHTGIVHDDPDYHNGQSIDFFSWYFQFMKEYVTVKQMTKMTCWVVILLLGFRVSILNIIIYMLICGLCSSFRLFYFGTYIPHRPEIIEEEMPWEKSKSANVSRWISFLSCYHFDYHWEHHRWPYVPWFDLWKYKLLRNKNV